LTYLTVRVDAHKVARRRRRRRRRRRFNVGRGIVPLPGAHGV
jgi:hypothetical protein